MTTRQSEIFEFIKEYISSKGYSPTYQEVGDAMGLTSVATVHKHVHCLMAEGRLTIPYKKHQGIEIVKQAVKDGRFELEADRLWDKKLKCYWVRER